MAALVSAHGWCATESVESIRVSPEVTLTVTVYVPDGQGPFPLLVVNHGKPLGDPATVPRLRYAAVAREFLKRGYAVIVPMREGFASSTGRYGDGGCDVGLTGRLQARDVVAALDYFTTKTWVDRQRIVVAGHSAGGLAAVAASAYNYPGVRGTINFAGGLKYWGMCPLWEDALADAMGSYGATSRLPSLWIYGKNDGHFGPDLARKMFSAYTASGAPATLVSDLKCRHTSDSHGAVTWSDGAPCWWPDVEAFLRSLGMPVVDLGTHEGLPEADK